MAEEKKEITTKKSTATKAPAEKASHHHTMDEAKVVVKKKIAEKKSYDAGVQYYGTGRRKDAVARVYMRPGTGKFIINDKDSTEYLDNRSVLVRAAKKPLVVANLEDKYDVKVIVKGGGKSGQSGAISHGLTRAIIELNPDLKKVLKIEGLVTRDSRVKETKKYGRKRARKGYTYRKR